MSLSLLFKREDIRSLPCLTIMLVYVIFIPNLCKFMLLLRLLACRTQSEHHLCKMCQGTLHRVVSLTA